MSAENVFLSLSLSLSLSPSLPTPLVYTLSCYTKINPYKTLKKKKTVLGSKPKAMLKSAWARHGGSHL
jgi:hypothetical protein